MPDGNTKGIYLGICDIVYLFLGWVWVDSIYGREWNVKMDDTGRGK